MVFPSPSPVNVSVPDANDAATFPAGVYRLSRSSKEGRKLRLTRFTGGIS
jgi:hypothetical protein